MYDGDLRYKIDVDDSASGGCCVVRLCCACVVLRLLEEESRGDENGSEAPTSCFVC
jgi:hypothetical protein